MTEPGDIRAQVRRGLAWVGAASSLVGVLDVVAYALVLGLWVTPTEFGVASLAVALFPVLDLATNLGLYAAVIQRDDHTPARVSTVFWLNLALSLLLFAALALGVGPLLDHIYALDVLTALLSVYGLKLIWQNVYFIPYALLERELRFQELSVLRVLGNLAEFAAKVGFAAAGFGIWCFVAGPLCRVFVIGVGVQIYRPWRPQLVFRLREARHWVLFGITSSAHRILFHLYTNADYLVVGYFFGPAANGLYALAYKLVLEPAYAIAAVLNRIAFPAFARLKDARDALIEQLVSLTRLNLVATLGFLAVAFVMADELLATIWGPEWAAAAPAVRILCVVGALRSLSFLLPPLLDALGRPGLSLTYTALAAVLLPASFVLAAIGLGDQLGYLSVAVAWALGYPIAFVVLVAISLGVLEMRALAFVRRVGRIPLWALISAGVGAGAELALQQAGVAALARLVAVALLIAGLFALLLVRVEKMRRAATPTEIR